MNSLLKNLWDIKWSIAILCLCAALGHFQSDVAAFCDYVSIPSEWLTLGGGGVLYGMYLQPRNKDFRPKELVPGTTTLLGTSVSVDLPNEYPIDAIDIVVDLTLGATAPSSLLRDGLLNVVKRVELLSHDPDRGGVRVNTSGIRLLEMGLHTQMNLDPATLSTISKTIGGYTNSDKHRIVYTVPLAPPQIQGKLRPLFMLPCHRHRQGPRLTIDFAGAAEMYGAGSLSTVSVMLYLHRRFVDRDIDAKIGRYIYSDLLEQKRTVAAGTSGEQSFKILGPGKFTGLTFGMYKGGASITRGDISETTTPGSETKWKLDIGGNEHSSFTMKALAALNARSRPLNMPTVASSPNIGPALAANTNYQDVAHFHLDFLSDGDGPVTELGGVLDMDRWNGQNLEVNLVGNVSNAATNGHEIYYLGHRIQDDISPWQAL